MLYDRLLRVDLLESARFVGLHDDSYRLLFIALLCRANDYGCLEFDTGALAHWVSRFTQLKTLENLILAISALADCDLVRRYEADGKPYLFIPRFRSARSYTTRSGIPLSPWCNADAPTGRVRVLARPIVQGKHETNDTVSATLAQHSAKATLVTTSPKGQVFELTAEIPKVSATLAKGWGGKEKKRDARSAARSTRLPEGWTIPDDWVAWAMAESANRGIALTASQVLTLAEQFRDYWLSTGKGRTDWRAAWRGWVRREDLRKWARSAQPSEIAPYT